MPTPFYHVEVAEKLLRDSSHYLQLLNLHRCSFLFGNTAPDVQVFSKQAREETHFFILPIQLSATLPWIVFLTQYPSLADPRILSADQAAFIAGYLCHLQGDWLWIRDVFAPIFGPTCAWGTFSQRLYLHNVLRTYLDLIALKELPADIDSCLAEVYPSLWLPFVSDTYLIEWRDFLVEQLHPGAAAQTVEVFAARQGISPQEFYRLLDSEERMEQEVFSHISRQKVVDFQRNLVYESRNILEWYFAGAAK